VRGLLRVRLDEYRLDPPNWTAPAGRIELVAFNAGQLPHNLAVVRRHGADVTARVEYARGRSIQPFERARLITRLPPGRYRLLCTIAGHESLGQYGELIVR
jgi:uncharacterized cupredoxin-like copper-binding protein